MKFDSVDKRANRRIANPVGNMYRPFLGREDILDGQDDLKSEGWCGFGTRDSGKVKAIFWRRNSM